MVIVKMWLFTISPEWVVTARKIVNIRLDVLLSDLEKSRSCEIYD